MKVKELREKLARLDDKADVYVVWEDGNERFFGIDDVSLQRGTPQRHSNDKVSFKREASGPVASVFISVTEE